eukprot:COSAG05_NODE_2317_length_3241_cov_1.711330_1_plen_467_part_10
MPAKWCDCRFDSDGGAIWTPLPVSAVPHRDETFASRGMERVAAAVPMPSLSAAEREPKKVCPDELELVRSFNGVVYIRHELMKNCNRNRRRAHEEAEKKVPTTLSSVERRWFVGRMSMEKAAEKAAQMQSWTWSWTPVPASSAETCVRQMLGTAALLDLAETGHRLISAGPSSSPNVTEVVLRVKSNKRGRPKKGGSEEEQTIKQRRYFIHDTVVALCKRYTAEFSDHMLPLSPMTSQAQGKAAAHVDPPGTMRPAIKVESGRKVPTPPHLAPPASPASSDSSASPSTTVEPLSLPTTFRAEQPVCTVAMASPLAGARHAGQDSAPHYANTGYPRAGGAAPVPRAIGQLHFQDYRPARMIDALQSGVYGDERDDSASERLLPDFQRAIGDSWGDDDTSYSGDDTSYSSASRMPDSLADPLDSDESDALSVAASVYSDQDGSHHGDNYTTMEDSWDTFMVDSVDDGNG